MTSSFNIESRRNAIAQIRAEINAERERLVKALYQHNAELDQLNSFDFSISGITRETPSAIEEPLVRKAILKNDRCFRRDDHADDNTPSFTPPKPTGNMVKLGLGVRAIKENSALLTTLVEGDIISIPDVERDGGLVEMIVVNWAARNDQFIVVGYFNNGSWSCFYAVDATGLIFKTGTVKEIRAYIDKFKRSSPVASDGKSIRLNHCLHDVEANENALAGAWVGDRIALVDRGQHLRQFVIKSKAHKPGVLRYVCHVNDTLGNEWVLIDATGVIDRAKSEDAIMNALRTAPEVPDQQVNESSDKRTFNFTHASSGAEQAELLRSCGAKEGDVIVLEGHRNYADGPFYYTVLNAFDANGTDGKEVKVFIVKDNECVNDTAYLIVDGCIVRGGNAEELYRSMEGYVIGTSQDRTDAAPSPKATEDELVYGRQNAGGYRTFDFTSADNADEEARLISMCQAGASDVIFTRGLARHTEFLGQEDGDVRIKVCYRRKINGKGDLIIASVGHASHYVVLQCGYGVFAGSATACHGYVDALLRA